MSERSRSELGRRALVLSAALALVLAGTSTALAESPSAPVAVQAQITARILPFERGFSQRVSTTVVIVIAERSGNADSTSAARQLQKALEDIGKVAGKPLRTQIVSYTSAGAFATECKRLGAVAMYITPGMGSEVKPLAAALVGTGVLSVAAVEAYVPDGAVLGVEIVSGKPRMSINLAQAKLQKLDFPSAVLKLARVY